MLFQVLQGFFQFLHLIFFFGDLQLQLGAIFLHALDLFLADLLGFAYHMMNGSQFFLQAGHILLSLYDLFE